MGVSIKYNRDIAGRVHGYIEIWYTDTVLAHRGYKRHGLVTGYNEWHKQYAQYNIT